VHSRQYVVVRVLDYPSKECSGTVLWKYLGRIILKGHA